MRSLSSLSAGGQGSEVRVQGSQESLERQRAQSPRLDRLKALRAVASELRVDGAVDSAAAKSTEGQKDKVKDRECRAQPNCEKSG